MLDILNKRRYKLGIDMNILKLTVLASLLSGVITSAVADTISYKLEKAPTMNCVSSDGLCNGPGEGYEVLSSTNQYDTLTKILTLKRTYEGSKTDFKTIVPVPMAGYSPVQCFEIDPNTWAPIATCTQSGSTMTVTYSGSYQSNEQIIIVNLIKKITLQPGVNKNYPNGGGLGHYSRGAYQQWGFF